VHKATGLRVVDEPQDFVSSDLLALRPRWGGFCMLLDAEEFGKSSSKHSSEIALQGEA